jgi:putative endonuclease
MASKRNGTLYIGVTSDLAKRVYEHKNDLVQGFTSQYGVKILVYFEAYDDFENAVKREKNIKAWKRAWKIEEIEKTNPSWQDLYNQIVQ